jgi:hypothetical protein
LAAAEVAIVGNRLPRIGSLERCSGWDRVMSRHVMYSADGLRPGSSPESFSFESDLPCRDKIVLYVASNPGENKAARAVATHRIKSSPSEFAEPGIAVRPHRYIRAEMY